MQARRGVFFKDRPTAHIRQLLHDDNGQDLIEYALLAGFIALGALMLPYFTASIQDAWNTVSSKLAHAM